MKAAGAAAVLCVVLGVMCTPRGHVETAPPKPQVNAEPVAAEDAGQQVAPEAPSPGAEVTEVAGWRVHSVPIDETRGELQLRFPGKKRVIPLLRFDRRYFRCSARNEDGRCKRIRVSCPPTFEDVALEPVAEGHRIVGGLSDGTVVSGPVHREVWPRSRWWDIAQDIPDPPCPQGARESGGLCDCNCDPADPQCPGIGGTRVELVRKRVQNGSAIFLRVTGVPDDIQLGPPRKLQRCRSWEPGDTTCLDRHTADSYEIWTENLWWLHVRADWNHNNLVPPMRQVDDELRPREFFVRLPCGPVRIKKFSVRDPGWESRACMGCVETYVACMERCARSKRADPGFEFECPCSEKCPCGALRTGIPAPPVCRP